MDIAELVRMTVDSISAHKLRSILITLGILIGISGVLVNVSMVKGVNAYFEKRMEALGSGFVTIEPGSREESSYGMETGALERHVFDAVRRLPYVEEATASRQAWATISYGDKENAVMVRGIEPGYLSAKNREMLAGASLVPQDRFNAIVDESVMRQVFHGSADLMTPFDLTITRDNGEQVTERFRIKGVVEASLSGMLGISAVYIPVGTLNQMLEKEGYTEITLLASDMDHIETVKEEAVEVLDRLFKVAPSRIPETSQKQGFLGIATPWTEEEERKEYYITTQSDVLDISREVTGKIQLALVAIASISLLVGGIGIANVMLVTVVERTREIGVMKAVGAKDWHVLTMFLMEAGIIGLAGGVIGVGMATALSYTLLPLFLQVPGVLPLEWVGIALGISLGIGIISGLYPAIRASRMDPVEALRHE